nr:MAG TPA: hypothetical protein [Caudoviricetes sp.]
MPVALRAAFAWWAGMVLENSPKKRCPQKNIQDHCRRKCIHKGNALCEMCAFSHIWDRWNGKAQIPLLFSAVLWDITMTISPNNGKVN